MSIQLPERRLASGQRGYTLIEILAVISLLAILMTLAAPAVRNFWFRQSLSGATDSVVSQLRQLQSRVTSESHPLVYGARFRKGSSEYALVVYDPRAVAPTPACRQEGATRGFDSGMFNATVRVRSIGTSVPDSAEATVCRTALAGVTVNDVFVFFYARGTGTAGTVSLEQPSIGDFETVTITALTGRVVRT